MSDIELITIIIARLEERRYTAESEIRLLNQRIQRLRTSRILIAAQVRQRETRRNTYNTYQDRNIEIAEDQQATTFFNQDNPDTENTTDEQEFPELAQAEQAFLEERGFENVRQPRNRVQQVPRAQQQRARRSSHTTNRRPASRPRVTINIPRDLEQERRVRTARIHQAANDIGDDIIKGIHINLRNIRNQVRRAHQT